jgi:hypothetical protein
MRERANLHRRRWTLLLLFRLSRSRCSGLLLGGVDGSTAAAIASAREFRVSSIGKLGIKVLLSDILKGEWCVQAARRRQSRDKSIKKSATKQPPRSPIPFNLADMCTRRMIRRATKHRRNVHHVVACCSVAVNASRRYRCLDPSRRSQIVAANGS